MNAGYRKNKIMIQVNHDTVVGGNEVDDWKDYYSCFAYANGLSGSEFWAANALNAESIVVFEVRYCSEIGAMTSINDTIKYRIVFNNQFYDIKNIDNVMFLNDNVKIRAQVGTWQNLL